MGPGNEMPRGERAPPSPNASTDTAPARGGDLTNETPAHATRPQVSYIVGTHDSEVRTPWLKGMLLRMPRLSPPWGRT